MFTEGGWDKAEMHPQKSHKSDELGLLLRRENCGVHGGIDRGIPYTLTERLQMNG